MILKNKRVSYSSELCTLFNFIQLRQRVSDLEGIETPPYPKIFHNFRKRNEHVTLSILVQQF